MVKIEFNIISRETIKPSSPTIQNFQPCNISLFDQLLPTTYAPLVLFYTKSAEANLGAVQLSTHLKKSLSETFNILYPFSGRVQDNLFIDRFDEGVPFLEAHVNLTMSEFLQDPKIESLNQFLPCPYFTTSPHNEVPLIACQVSIFSCGGIALGVSMCHKIADGSTTSTFLNLWSAISCGKSSGVETLLPNLTKASLVFPPRQDLPNKHTTQTGEMWFQKGNKITRRFAFDAKAIDTLRIKTAKGEGNSRSSPIQALSCFIWKRFMATSTAITSSPRPCVFRFPVNLRGLVVPRLDGAIGNLYLVSKAIANPDLELHELARLLSEGISKVSDPDFIKSMQGDEGFQAIYDGVDHEKELLSNKNQDVLTLSSWSKFGYEALDFGVGETAWVGLFGNMPTPRNTGALIETKWNKGYEAWLILDEERMAILEHDPEFLAYASPNPKISIKDPTMHFLLKNHH